MNFSVVVPAFNAERFLSECLLSILKQTVKPYEIIVVDDGSTDETAEIAYAFCAEVVSHKQNLGIGAARQSGAEKATGDYVCFLSADDRYSPRFLEASAKLVDGEKACFSSYFQCNPKLRAKSCFKPPIYSGSEDFKRQAIQWALKKNMFVNFSSVVLPKKIFDSVRFESDLRHGEDLIFLLDTLIAGLEWIHVNEPLVYYRVHGSQGTNLRSLNEWMCLWRHLCSRLVSLGVSEDEYWKAFRSNYSLLFPRLSLKQATANIAHRLTRNSFDVRRFLVRLNGFR